MWNEIQQVGTDYQDVAEVAAYDQRMGTIRDVEEEIRQTLARLALPAGARLLDIGSGTGRLLRAAAARGLQAYAADVSAVMLEYLEKRSAEEGVKLVELQHAGFLTMSFPGEHFDAVVSSLALHHLPDAWKLVGLRNVARVLKSRGQFLLRDVVFSLSEGQSPEDCFESFCAAYPPMREETARHAAREYSTYDWIMSELLKRAGFEILEEIKSPGSIVLYHCRKM
jgi:ubiquinone/menaquinone biosynthesis C-methylase UbiE